MYMSDFQSLWILCSHINDLIKIKKGIIILYCINIDTNTNLIWSKKKTSTIKKELKVEKL